MCGFVFVARGTAGGPRNDPPLDAMLAAITHRGPDDSGTWGDERFLLGFRRLSILDLSAHGHQPMLSPDGRHVICFNGEIYNYVELRRELEALGRRFVSTGDTEVLLQGYAQWGDAVVDRLNGMWAFVIVDRQTGRAFGSRDRLGIKPLYLHDTGRELIAASEIKAIVASTRYTVRPDLDAAADYLVSGQLDHRERTMFDGIVPLAAGHAFEIDAAGRFRSWPYWRPQARTSAAAPADPVEAFASLFEDAIRLHMRSDVPVAVHLSGGLDSTSIACAAARVRAETGAQDPLYAFSYNDKEFDETRFIDDTLAQTGARKIALQTDALRIWSDLPAVIAAQDEPVHSLTPVVGYQLMKLTADHGIRVVLNGQGADEVLGGYPSYFRDRWMSELLDHGPLRAWREVARYAEAKGQPARQLFQGLLRHALQSSLRRSAAYRRASHARFQQRNRALTWITPDLASRASGQPHHASPRLADELVRSMQLDPLPVYLRVEDRNAMAHSVEGRVPFLDHRLVEMSLALDDSWKMAGDLNKYILRAAMEGRIPPSVLERREKFGFPTSAARWLRDVLHAPAREVLASLPNEQSYGLSRSGLLALLESHQRQQADHSPMLVRALQWIIWSRQQGLAG
jgi:asparagine synthase (glutamine-hydrolysing)